jgi:hypothetical protein
MTRARKAWTSTGTDPRRRRVCRAYAKRISADMGSGSVLGLPDQNISAAGGSRSTAHGERTPSPPLHSLWGTAGPR